MPRDTIPGLNSQLSRPPSKSVFMHVTLVFQNLHCLKNLSMLIVAQALQEEGPAVLGTSWADNGSRTGIRN